MARRNSYGVPRDFENNYWTARFGRGGRRDERGFEEFISVPGFGPEGYGFGAP